MSTVVRYVFLLCTVTANKSNCTGSRIRISNTGKNRIKTYETVIILSLQDTFLPLLMAKLKMYGLYDNFAEMAHGFCDFASFMTAMHMGQICRATKFGDMVDVYKQVTGRPWPKDVTHRYSTGTCIDQS
jgi:hypothetical protein